MQYFHVALTHCPSALKRKKNSAADKKKNMERKAWFKEAALKKI